MKLKNESEYIEFVIGEIFDEDYPFGGKSCEVYFYANVSFLNIKFHTYSSTGVFSILYNELKECYNRLNGTVNIKSFSYEEDMDLKIIFQTGGHVKIEMNLKSNDEQGNKCTCNFETDQTFIKEFLGEIRYEMNL